MPNATPLTQTEAAQLLRASRWTVRRLIRDNHLPVDLDTEAICRLIAHSALPTPEDAVSRKEIPHLYTLAEVAEETGLSLRSLQDGARRNPPRFAHYRISGKRLMSREDIDQMLANNRYDPERGDPAVAAELRRRSSRGGRGRPVAA